MGRVELLFGEMASGSTTMPTISCHQPPDGLLPLRMQAVGRGPARQRMLRWRIALWRRSLRSRAGWRRASVMAMFATALQAIIGTPVARLLMLAIMFGAVALISGAWADAGAIADTFEVGSN